jgi:hypothetical protein
MDTINYPARGDAHTFGTDDIDVQRITDREDVFRQQS